MNLQVSQGLVKWLFWSWLCSLIADLEWSQLQSLRQLNFSLCVSSFINLTQANFLAKAEVKGSKQNALFQVSVWIKSADFPLATVNHLVPMIEEWRRSCHLQWEAAVKLHDKRMKNQSHHHSQPRTSVLYKQQISLLITGVCRKEILCIQSVTCLFREMSANLPLCARYYGSYHCLLWRPSLSWSHLLMLIQEWLTHLPSSLTVLLLLRPFSSSSAVSLH